MLSGETNLVEINDPGVIWSAVIGGAVAALAFLFMMAPLGASLGFLVTSPWSAMDTSHKAFTLMSAIWLILMQWIASGIGGYLTGRLRTGWAGAHTHEVFFRDTAHGFLSWALATVLGVVLLTVGMAHVIEKHSGRALLPEDKAVSLLLKSDQANTALTEQERSDVSLVLLPATTNKTVEAADKAYLEQLVQTRAGLSAVDAERRVDDTISRLKETKHIERKALATSGLLIFLSMWIGAFIASAAGALGGQHRDLHYVSGSLSAN